MFVIFGTRSTYLKDVNYNEDDACPHCNNSNTFLVKTKASYFHIFWIPIVPISKKQELHCTHCKKVYAITQLPQEIQVKVNRMVAQSGVKRPLWHGCGCLVMGVFLLIPFILTIISTIIALFKG
jgi:uncharacterized protein YbaR (Trm112 family)